MEIADIEGTRDAAWTGSFEQGSTRPDAAEVRSVLFETRVHVPLLGETLGELIDALRKLGSIYV